MNLTKNYFYTYKINKLTYLCNNQKKKILINNFSYRI